MDHPVNNCCTVVQILPNSKFKVIGLDANKKHSALLYIEPSLSALKKIYCPFTKMAD